MDASTATPITTPPGNPSLPTFYGVPAGSPADASGMAVTQTRSGAMHPVGGGPLTVNPNKAAGKAGYATNDLPPIYDYFKSRGLLDNPKNPIQPSQADDPTLAGWANDYYNMHLPGHLEGVYNRKLTAKDPEVVSQIGQANAQFASDLPQVKAWLTKQDGLNAPAVPPAGPGAGAVANTLGQEAIGAAEHGASSFVTGAPSAAANILLGPFGKPLADLAGGAGTGNKLAKTIATAVTPSGAPKVASDIEAASAANLPGGANFSPESDAIVNNHPILSQLAQVGGSLIPYAVSALAGPAGPAAVGMAAGGGDAKKEEYNRVMAIKDEDIAKLPKYQELLKQTGSPEAAKTALATLSAEQAEKVGQMSGGVMGLIGGAGGASKAGQAAIAKIVGTNVLKRAAATGGAEAAGFAGQQIAGNAATTAATNKLTGETRAPSDEGVGTAAVTGGVAGLIGALLHARGVEAKPGDKGSKTPPPKPGETPAAGAPAAPVNPDAYAKAAHATLADPDLHVAPGTPEEKVFPVLADALENFEGHLNQHAPGMAPEAKAAALAQFEKDYRTKFGVPAPEGAAPAAGETPAPQATEAPVSAEEAAGATTPEAEAAKAAEAIPTAGEPTPEAQQAAAAVHNETEPPTPEEALAARGAVHEGAPEVPARSTRELATQPGVDTRLPFGVTEPIVEHLRQELGREPTADEINEAAHHKLGRLTQVAQQAHPDILSVSPIARREAIGQLLSEGKAASPEEILKRAQKMIADGTVQSTISERIAEHEKGPKAEEAKAKADAEEKQAFRNTLKKTSDLVKKQAADKEAARIKEEAARKEAQDKEEAAKAKAEADLKAEAAKHAAENTPEKANERLKNRLKKIDEELAAEKKPPKPEAAEHGSEAANDETEFNQTAHDDLVKAGADPVLADRLLKWLTDRAPHLIKDLKIQLHETSGVGKRGNYDPIKQIAHIFADKRNDVTVAHEVLHHLERLMPSDVQEGIIKDWQKAIDREIAAAQKAGDMQRVANLEKQKVINRDAEGKPTYDAFRQAIEDHANNPERITSEYSLVNPSEYWAVNASRILNDRANATTWGAKAKQWIKEFIEHIKGAFGMKSDAPILNALKYLMNGKQSTIPAGAKMLAHRVKEFNQMTTDEKADYVAKAWAPADITKTTWWKPWQKLPTKEAVRDLSTAVVNEYKPWQNYNRDQEKAGHFIRPEQDVFKALTLARGAGEVKANADRAEVLEPFMNRMAQLAKSLGIESGKLKEFIANATNGVTARHALERNKVHYMETVRLSPEAEKLRQPLLLDTYTKKMAPGEYLKKLREIVYAPDARIEKGGIREASGISDEVAYKMLKNVDDAGVSQETIDKVNEALQPIRDRSLKNGIESGRYTEDERRLLDAKGFKYYMPLKGFADELPSPTNPGRQPLGAFNKDTRYMAGRAGSLSDNPLENLLADLNTSSKDISGNQLVARSAYFAASDPNSKLGAVIRHYNMDKMYKEALAAGSVDFNGQSRRQYWTEKLKKAYQNPNTVIYNAGKDKYVIEFPEGSKELKALKAAQAANDLDGIQKTVGKFTNFYSRVHTAFSPAFSIITAPIRDILSYPLMIGFDKGIRATAEYAASATKYGGPFGAWKNYVDLGRLKGRSIDEIRQIAAKQKPDSFANRLIQLSDLGGGFNFTDELSKARDASGIADAIAKMQSNSLANPKALLHRFSNLLDSFATGSLMAGRVAAFDALLKRGVEPSEAALYAKRLLNFQQTSEYGRKANAFYAFFRAGITNADRTAELFRNHDGSFNGHKLAAAAALGTAASAAWYQMLLAKYGDDKMKEIEDSTMAGNFVMPWEGADGHPMKIPMGLGLPRMMFGLGMLATRYAHGHTTMTSAAQTALNTAVENMTPARPIQSQPNESTGDKALDLAMALVPSAARAPAELGINRNAFGTPIHNQDYGDETKFKSESGRVNTPELFKEIAEGLNKYSGVDVYPESLEHLTNEWGPGVVTDAIRGYALHSEGAPLSKYPGVSTLTVTDSDRAPDRAFYGQRDSLQEAVKEADLLKRENKPIPASLQKQVAEADALKKASVDHGREIKQIESNKLLSPEAKAIRVEQAKRQWSVTERKMAAEAARVNP